MKQINNLTAISSAEDLQLEKRKLKALLLIQESELRIRAQKIPGELIYAGMNAVVPSVLSGKITTYLFTAVKDLLIKAFLKKEESDSSKWVNAIKRVGIFIALRLLYKTLIQKK